MNLMNEMASQEWLYKLAEKQAKANGTNSQKSIDEIYFKLVESRKKVKARKS